MFVFGRAHIARCSDGCFSIGYKPFSHRAAWRRTLHYVRLPRDFNCLMHGAICQFPATARRASPARIQHHFEPRGPKVWRSGSSYGKLHVTINVEVDHGSGIEAQDSAREGAGAS